MDITSFFSNSETVWTSENFQNVFLSKYQYTESQQEWSLRSTDLQDINSQVNAQEFIFPDADVFLEQLALLIKDQINGEEGKLLNDSSANYFFVKGKDGNYYSILIRWEQAQKLWRCGAYLQETLKIPNIRIFYSA
jgi:hypothetical protein